MPCHGTHTSVEIQDRVSRQPRASTWVVVPKACGSVRPVPELSRLAGRMPRSASLGPFDSANALSPSSRQHTASRCWGLGARTRLPTNFDQTSLVKRLAQAPRQAQVKTRLSGSAEGRRRQASATRKRTQQCRLLPSKRRSGRRGSSSLSWGRSSRLVTHAALEGWRWPFGRAQGGGYRGRDGFGDETHEVEVRTIRYGSQVDPKKRTRTYISQLGRDWRRFRQEDRSTISQNRCRPEFGSSSGS